MTSPDIPSRLSAALADRYRIERELGRGGMATVYLAEDVKHSRQVAIKVLRPELAAVLGADRFVQEIQTTAQLQHPHILPLFDSGEADGFLYYVMPYLSGETLRTKLNRETQLGIEEAIQITTDVADALEYAHRHGVIHRDIKPENILLHDGRPTVADFGIALALSAAAGGRMTETGMSLGTPHYMSPEQATADKDITGRSDIYSLASVLYEMLTGEPPHMGNSAQQIIMKIVAEQAQPVTRLRKSVPPNVAAAVAQALEKLPADRFDSAKAFAAALTNPTFTRADLPGMPRPGGSTGALLGRLTIPLVVGFVLAVAAAAWGWLRTPPAAPLVQLPITLPDSATLFEQAGVLFDLSADGSKIVYTGPGEGDDNLWVRPLGALTATMISGTLGADSPFLSPDGDVVAFFSAKNRALYTVSLRGGPRQTLAEGVATERGGDFGRDGYIYFASQDGIRRVAEGRGPTQVVTHIDTAAGETAHAWIDVLPNGKGAVFTIQRQGGLDQNDIATLNLKTGKRHVLFRGVYARYAAGHLVYADAAGGLFAIAFDQGTLTTQGNPMPLVSGVRVGAWGEAQFAVSETGMLLYGSGAGSDGGRDRVVWVDRTGESRAVDTSFVGTFFTLALSPNAHTLAISRLDQSTGQWSIWTKQLEQGPVSKLTLEGDALNPAWTHDGREVTFTRTAGGAGALYARRADGSGNAMLLLKAARRITYGFVSPDSQWIIYQTAAEGAPTERDILARRLGGDTSTVTLVATSDADVQPRLAPDGHWLAYTSTVSDQPEVYVSPFPNASSGRTQVSVNGGAAPLWSRDGRELFYLDVHSRMLIAAEVATTPSFRVLGRKPLFDASAYRVRSPNGGLTFDVSPDGTRFIMVAPGQRQGSERLLLVQHWPAMLTTPGDM